ncbi:MAG: hypothetical protein MSC31_15815 [Solirubrobacteraceae bacterium MAG38_C4-C5]|nr:hypothetical protein [Candidatus Siliceabacter maunaloa]
MTAKEQLRQRIEGFTEEQALETLRVLERETDPVREFFANAPEDDEPVSAEEDAAAAEARDEVQRGETVSLEQARGELLG